MNDCNLRIEQQSVPSNNQIFRQPLGCGSNESNKIKGWDGLRLATQKMVAHKCKYKT